MLRKQTFTIALLATLLLTACQTHDEHATDPSQSVDVLSRFGADGKAWLTLDISTDAVGSLRRAANGSFDDGDPSESAVKTLTLVLFHGSGTEDDCRVASTYNLLFSSADDGHQQVTSHSETTLQISAVNISTGDDLYMMAIANASPTITAGTTFASLKTTLMSGVTNNIDDTPYYVMSSGLMATANDGSGHTLTLTPISAYSLYGSAEEATAHPAGGHIFLERAAVKVTVDTDEDLDLHIAGNTNIDFTRADLWYSLFNYNTSYYLVRQFDDSWLSYNASSTGYRFVESAPLPTGKYRTYWAKDPNYDNGGSLDAYFKQWNVMGVSDYCAENTFDVTHMVDLYTTSVVIALALNDGANFYTASTTGSDVVYQEPSTTISEEGTSADQSFAPRRSVSAAKPIDEYLREWLLQTNSDFRRWVNQYAGGEANHVKIAVKNKNTDTGLATFTASQTAQSGGAGATAFEALHLDNYMAGNIVIRYYYQGLCYYRVPIRHFGNELTPWTSTPTMTASTPTAAYDNDAASYLGRYGVVRNNWYQISIKRITHVGSPIVPPLTSDADDQIEQLLNATLYITGWTPHEQDI